jgi:hypothetical protein
VIVYHPQQGLFAIALGYFRASIIAGGPAGQAAQDDAKAEDAVVESAEVELAEKDLSEE